ncbi:hypothetical protein [Jeotgalibacillus sp. JSM ZJ347]|uniref:hypothetical protein n=1 Tax=Jeotgalibacillus sp. JSM ZJ347 TaxID=3342117 RepID=UPI0035A8FC67
MAVDEEKEHRVFGGCLPADDCTAENLFFEITEATQWTKKTGMQHPKKLNFIKSTIKEIAQLVIVAEGDGSQEGTGEAMAKPAGSPPGRGKRSPGAEITSPI